MHDKCDAGSLDSEQLLGNLTSARVLEKRDASRKCGCSNHICFCNFNVSINQPKLKIKIGFVASLQMSYVPANSTLRSTLKLDKKVIFDKTISIRNPPAICETFSILNFKLGLCLRVSNVTLSIPTKQLSFCPSIELKVLVFKEVIEIHCVAMPLKL